MADESMVGRVAKSLTKAQQTFLMENSHRFSRGYKPGEKLVELGLLHREARTFGDRVHLTEAGDEVRTHLIDAAGRGRGGVDGE